MWRYEGGMATKYQEAWSTAQKQSRIKREAETVTPSPTDHLSSTNFV